MNQSKDLMVCLKKTGSGRGEGMQFKTGIGWKACYDEATGIYTAERGGGGSYHLYEITKEIFDRLENGLSDWDVYEIIDEGRHLYMDVNDR
jgi:hypothetical protein